MESRHEIIQFGSNIPVKLFLHKVGDVSRHWHQSLELLLILSGHVSILVDNRLCELQEDDIILINSNQIHELHGDNCVIAALQIKLAMFDNKLVDEKKLWFKLNSIEEKDNESYARIKTLLAEMVRFNSEKSPFNEILNKSFAYSLLYELMTTFKSEDAPKNYAQTQKHLDRLTSILNYINQNIDKPLMLREVAEREYLSLAYLSRFFEKNMGISFSVYVAGLRLRNSVDDLIRTNLSIEEIAAKNGFPNARAFTSSFKKEYETLPSSYRKQGNRPGFQSSAITDPKAGDTNYLRLEQSGHLAKLASYLNKQPTPMKIFENEHPEKHPPTVRISMLPSGCQVKPSWSTFVCAGRAKELLYGQVQQMLRTTQREIGFRYIKFHGLFNDDMMVYSEDANGKPLLQFYYIDQLLDFLLSINLKPFIQLSFMPEQLALEPDKKIFHSGMITSLPKDMEKWTQLVEQFTRHVMDRYGEAAVASWPFSLWNEPDTPRSMFGFGDSNLYHAFYRDTYKAVKNILPSVSFGSPSIVKPTIESNRWLQDFLSFCIANDCKPDFIAFNFYPILHGQSETYRFDDEWDFSSGRLMLSNDPDCLSSLIGALQTQLGEAGFSSLPLYMIEWNSTSSHRELLNDTCFEAAYIVKNILENHGRLDSFGHWALTDLLEEQWVEKELFHGGLGLFTNTGIKKPGYHAYHFLSKLGSSLLGQGEGYFLTTSGNDHYQLLMYNYQHYSELYASGELFDMTFENRYTPFVSPHRLRMSFTLDGLGYGNYLIAERIVNRNHGSAFDKWLETGGLPLSGLEETEALKALSEPMLKKTILQVRDGRAEVGFCLEPHEIRLVTFQRVFSPMVGGDRSTQNVYSSYS